ncbi:FAD-binding protein [Streptomyces sp. NPDC051956]|uniref:FAD-binding protein n=1 Tax=Streptomyces sp. NPDC051956 TaxID=3365677 RepID=UPI0037D86BBB
MGVRIPPRDRLDGDRMRQFVRDFQAAGLALAPRATPSPCTCFASMRPPGFLFQHSRPTACFGNRETVLRHRGSGTSFAVTAASYVIQTARRGLRRRRHPRRTSGEKNELTDKSLLDTVAVRRQIEPRDLQITNPYSKDSQVQGIRNARRYLGDRLGRTAAPHRILDPSAGPLIGVKLHVVTRKTLGGIQTDLDSRALGVDGRPVDGLYAAGEVAGFGGGGVHGYNALEGTFLGGCLFSGRRAGRAAAEATAS